MKRILLLAIALTACLVCFAAWAAEPPVARQQVMDEARRGFEEILDLWRDERYAELYDRLIPTPGSDRWRFEEQLNYSGRRPACCWEKLQDVSITFIDERSVSLHARLGIEVEGVGTRFVTRSFHLEQQRGVWKLPEADVISLAEPNMQRIPREIPVRSP